MQLTGLLDNFQRSMKPSFVRHSSECCMRNDGARNLVTAGIEARAERYIAQGIALV
jgi:hypothetical protein